MKIITIKLSEEGRDEIITSRVSIDDANYALAYYASVKEGFVKFPAFAILDVTITDAPTLDQRLVALGEDLQDAMMDKLSELEDDILHKRTPARFDDIITDDETGESHGIVYPENGAPELDEARHHVGDAVLALRGMKS